ncbi:MAG: 50S ribosomal protein L25/general stress protein Ctc, partial [Cyclobacteriaceae bacterium]
IIYQQLIYFNMKTLEIIGYKRANLGKSESKRLRAESNVPCVLYGGDEQVHFYSPMILFRDLVYTPKAHFVNLDIEGTEYRCILQDIQFHPVSEMILHADFLLLNDKKEVTMEIPVKTVGVAPGIQAGGKLVMKQRKLSIRATPDKMPDTIDVDISGLTLGKSTKVGEIDAKGYTIINNPLVSVASVEVPRALRGKSAAELEAEEEEA